MEENMENTEFNVSMLCQLVGMDNKQLYRKVKQLAGVTPVDLIRRIRMKKAAVLLSQHRFSVSEVMYMVGYSNPSYFSKCFVAEYKISPSQYASKLQSERKWLKIPIGDSHIWNMHRIFVPWIKQWINSTVAVSQCARWNVGWRIADGDLYSYW